MNNFNMPSTLDDDVVFVEDAPRVQTSEEPTLGASKPETAPVNTIVPDEPENIFNDDITFEDQTKGTSISAAPPKPSVWERIRSVVSRTDFKNTDASVPFFGALKLSQELTKEFAPKETPEHGIARAQNIHAISDVTGLSRKEVADHYHDMVRMSSITGIEADPTNQEVIEKSMMVGLIPAFATAPAATAGGLLLFGALDHLIPTEKFIPEDASPSARDTINLVGLLAKGAVVGGIAGAARGAFSRMVSRNETAIDFAFARHTYEKLKQKNLPTEIQITPEQLLKLNGLDKPQLPAPAFDRARGEGFTILSAEQAAQRRSAVVDSIARRAANGDQLDPWMKVPSLMKEAREHLFSPEYRGKIDVEAAKKILPEIKNESKFKMDPEVERIFNERMAKQAAKEEVLADEHAIKYAKFKSKYGEPRPADVERVRKSARERAQAEFIQEISQRREPAQDPGILGSLGIDRKTLDAAVETGSNVTVRAEKVAQLAVKSEKEFQTFKDTLFPVEGQEGKVKTSKLATSIEEKARIDRMTDGFQDTLPTYRQANMEALAKKGAELAKSDYDMAYRIAMGQERAPKDQLPEMIFKAVEDIAREKGDIATIEALATRSSLPLETVAMGQRIRALGERDIESPVDAIQVVRAAREKSVSKRIGKKDINAEVQKISKEIKDSIAKSKPKATEWADFIKSLECK